MRPKSSGSFSHAGQSQNRLAWLTVVLVGLLFPIGAHAQSCPVRIPFPPPGSTPTVLNAGTLCLSNTNASAVFPGPTTLRFLGPTGQPPNGLALFYQGELWCAHASNGSCAQGTQLVLRPDGNLELNDGNTQTWDTDTPHTNNGHEFLKVTKHGQACIVVVDPRRNTETQIWCSNNSPF
jgi:hypothetical protein